MDGTRIDARVRALGRVVRRFRGLLRAGVDEGAAGLNAVLTGVGTVWTGVVNLLEAVLVGLALSLGYLLVVVEWTVLSTLVTAWRLAAIAVGRRTWDGQVTSLWAVEVMADRPSVARIVLSLGLAFGLEGKTAFEGWKAQLDRWRARRPVIPGVVTALGGVLIGYIPLRVAMSMALVPQTYMFAGAIFGIIVVVSGLAAIGKPDLSSFFGGLAILVSVLSIVGALGGLMVGLTVGCIGGSLLYAWQPPASAGRDPESDSAASTSEPTPA